MKAAVFHEPFKISTEEVEMPEPGDGEILLNVKACGICGSDLHMYKLDLFTEKLCRQTSKGGVPGHEMSGDIVRVGNGVLDFKAGDRVVAVTSGGGMAEFNTTMVIPGMTVIKLPDEVGYEEAATLEPLANSLHATLKGNPAPGENIVVFGAGIIGLGIVQCLKALDLELGSIIMVDVSDGRLEAAKALGADHLVNAAKSDPEEKIREIVGWTPLLTYSDESSALVDVVYDCVGYMKERSEPPVIQLALNLVREFTGRVVVHGLFEENVSMDFSPMVLKQVDVLGSFAYFPDDLARSLEMMRSGKVDRRQIISHTFPLDQVKAAFDMQCDVENSVKVIVKPGPGSE
jgi:2-desacetyl-2-hydroxyethyl bacteriochlorophyllide A dehydrogenase